MNQFGGLDPEAKMDIVVGLCKSEFNNYGSPSHTILG